MDSCDSLDHSAPKCNCETLSKLRTFLGRWRKFLLDIRKIYLNGSVLQKNEYIFRTAVLHVTVIMSYLCDAAIIKPLAPKFNSRWNFKNAGISIT
jgi:hypothetical protein